MKPLVEIIKLNQTRYGLDFNGPKAIEKLHEEIIEELAPAITILDVEEIVDALADTIVIAVGELTKLGHKPYPLPTKLNPQLVIEQSTLAKLTERLTVFKEAILITDNKIVIVNTLHDIIQVAAEGLLELKYQPTLVLKQIVKVISSRLQDPVQAAAWASGNRQPGEKWIKDKSQDPSTLYEVDFSTCKFK